uniref:BTB domain-containing protein n=1 Tax=Globisporangium ultimum (strain ATCC 200006 / CBS 805.95 / DAOM BR144) TaxID=431595 RepID=K3WGV0_GLOUD
MALNNRKEQLVGSASDDRERASEGVYSFGQNSYGELGHGDTTDRATPTRVMDAAFQESQHVVDVACGNEQTVLLCASGDVYACGYNDSGQCGTGSTERVPTLRVVSALSGKNIVHVFSGNGCEHLAALSASGTLYTVGFNSRGQLGHGTTVSMSEPSPIHTEEHACDDTGEGIVGKRVMDVACSYFHTAIVTTDGALYTCGRNDFGQLGTSDGVDKHAPHPVRFFFRHPVLAVACGQHHTLASLSSGGLVAFGKNDHGQLGMDHGSGAVAEPTRVTGALEHAVIPKLACGYYHSVAVTEDGAVYTFGRNDYGQLGLGHTKNVATPTLVETLARVRIVQVACGCYHTLALSDDGKVYPFGRNNHGQLGLETTRDCLSPQLIPSLRNQFVRKVAAGFYHSVCLTGDLDGAGAIGGSGKANKATLNSDLRRLLNNPDAHSDVTFLVEGQPFYAHRCILMARCEPLEKMLDGRMNDAAQPHIVIPDYSSFD